MGFLEDIFGGSQTQQTSTSTPSNYTAPALQGLSPELAQSLSQLLGSFTQQNTSAGNPLTGTTATPQAPLSGQENQLLGQLPGQISSGNDYIQKSLSGAFLPGQPGANPFFDAAVRAAQRPTLEGLQETLSRSLPGRFTANGQFIQPNTGDQGGSSAFDRAAAIATRGAANAVGDIATNMGNAQFGQERQLQQNSVGLEQGQVDSMIKGLQASALPRLIQQNGLDQGLALFQQQTQNLLDILKTIGAVQAPVLANTTVSQGTSTTEKGIIPGITGAIGAFFPKGI